MIKAFQTLFTFLRNPLQGWSLLKQQATQDSVVSIYIIMVFAGLCTAIGNYMELILWKWSDNIIAFLGTSISLLASLYIALFLVKLYYEKTEKQLLSNSICIHFVAFASVGVYLTFALVELTHISLFWLFSLYTIKLVLESIQSGYIAVEEKRKHTFIWVCSAILILAPIITYRIIGSIIHL